MFCFNTVATAKYERKFPIYELAFTYNLLATYAVRCTAAVALFFLFMYNISTHFKMLNSCTESIDEIFPKTMETTNECCIDKETLNMNSIPKAHSWHDKIFSQVLPGVVRSGREGVQHEREEIS